MKIFLVDDEPFALKLMERQLQTLGFTDVTLHTSAVSALGALEQDAASAELILLDLQMPDVDGVECVRHLARLRYSGGLILVSGEDERVLATVSALASAHSLDVIGAINKPVPPETLKRLLTRPRAPMPPPKPTLKLYDVAQIAEAIDRGDLVNHYQPMVELTTGRVMAVETLVRWQHAFDGMVFPEQFVAQSEETRCIDALARAVLTEALQQARRWHDAGHEIAVAVNVSMANLVTLDFPDFVGAAVKAAGVPPEKLVLEVTESRLMTNVLTALDVLTRLRLKRVSLSIDDFGTGHASLAQLRSIPFDELKIDRSFVHGAHRDAASRAIVEASLSMARQLGLKTVAEGIEDRADFDLMRTMGCDLAQGFFIARPMPADTFDAWHAEWETHRGLLFTQ